MQEGARSFSHPGTPRAYSSRQTGVLGPRRPVHGPILLCVDLFCKNVI